MTRSVSFLRGLNVGGHRVKMADLCGVFEDMGFEEVASFLASGNVIFAADPGDTAALERRIEGGLRDALGYDVATFIRSFEELRTVAAPARLDGPPLAAEDGVAINVVFLKQPATEPLRAAVAPLRTADDDFIVHGRELYWLRRGKISESPAWAPFEKALGDQGTTRNMNTVRRILSKFSSDS